MEAAHARPLDRERTRGGSDEDSSSAHKDAGAGARVGGPLPRAHAQTGAASITGLVTDQSGAAAPGVTVTATNQATNVAYTGVSNDGRQLHDHVAARRHLRREGRRSPASRPSTTQADRRSRRSRSRASTSRWRSARSRTRSRSTAQAPVLQTESATVGEVISGNTVQSLPLNGRNIGQLALLLPGTVTYNPRGFTNIGSVNMNRPFVNGNREQTNNFTVDGLDVNETIDNRVAYQPSPDALAEISVETNNYAADVGQRRRRGHQQRHQVGREQVPRQRVRVLPEQRLRREHLGEQPLRRAARRSASSTSSAAPWAARSSRTSSSSSPTTRARGRTRPGSATASVAPEAWRRGDLSSVSDAPSAIRSPGCPSRATRSRSTGSARPRARS